MNISHKFESFRFVLKKLVSLKSVFLKFEDFKLAPLKSSLQRLESDIDAED